MGFRVETGVRVGARVRFRAGVRVRLIFGVGVKHYGYG